MPIVKQSPRPQKHGLLVRRWYVFALLLVLLVVLVGVVVSYGAYFSKRNNQEEASGTSSEVVSKPVPVSISNKSLFFGTTYWGRYINDWSQANELKTAYPFSRLNELERDRYDAWIANLECPTVPNLNLTSAQEEATLSFNCSPTYLKEAKKWFTAFGSANNHSDNQGAEGLDSTRSQLKKAGIQYFGHYDPEKLSDVCEIISLPVKVKYNDDTQQKGAIPLAMCGYHGVFKIPSIESLAVMNRYSKLMPVIAYPHSGAEYKAEPDEIKTTLYRSMIDNGADMVLGDHPHWIQTTEAYKGKLIVYSMGNFIFDQQFNQEVTRGAAIELSMSTKQDVSADELKKWLDIGPLCTGFQDSCLETAQKNNVQKLPLNYQFNFVATDNAQKIVKRASPTQRSDIEARLRWQSTMNQLQPPYSSL